MAFKEVVNFDASFDDAEKSLKTFSKQTTASLNSISKSFKALGAVAAAAVGFLAARELVQGLNAAIDAAAESEESINQLNTALALAGDYTANASKEFQNFAKQLQATTTFEDDAILKQVALAKTFGVTNDEAQKLVKTATDLAAATGVSLDTAVDQLGKTLTGTTGALGKTIPGLKDLSQEALKSGVAIDLIAKRFSGAASAATGTFNGSMAQLGNVFGDLQEEIGNVIVQNPVVLAGIQALSKVFSKLTDFVVANQDTLKSFVSVAVTLAFKAIPYLVDAFEVFGKILLSIREVVLNVSLAFVSFYRGLYEIKGVQVIFKTVFTFFKTILTQVVATLSGFLDLLAKLPGAGKYLNPLVDGLDEIGGTLTAITGDEALGALTGGLDTVGDSLAKSLEGSDKLFDSFTKGAKDARTFAEGLATSVESAGKKATATAGIFDKLNASGGKVKIDDDDKKKEKEKDLAKETGPTLFDQIVSGLELGASIAANIFNGGFVNQFSSFVEQIGNAPKAFLEAFQNLDGIIQGLLDTLPKVIESLLAQAPGIIKSIIAAIPELVQMIVKGLSAIATIIADSAPALFAALLDGITALVEAVPGIVDTLLKALPSVLKAIMQKLPALITAIFKALPQIVRSIAQVIPELVSEFAANIGPIVLAVVQGFLEAIPEIMMVLVDEFLVKGGLFRMMGAIAAAMPDIAIALVQGIVRAAFNTTGALVDYLGKALGGAFSGAIKLPEFNLGEARDVLTGKFFAEKIKENFGALRDFLSGKLFFDKVKTLFDKFIEQIKTVLSGGLAGGKNGAAAGALGGLGKAIGFSKGGIVPLYAASGAFVPRGTDTVPAMLTPGERVLSVGQNAKLESLLDRLSAAITGQGEPDQPIMVQLSISDQQLATAVFNARKRGFRI